ncbi:MAG: hypothetical protein LH480_00690 [Rubrivivax sp.]|nr:hypothetical protein [Rubrivivax sp.]
MPYLRADGSSDGKRLRQLGHDRLDYSQLDMLWPLLAPPQDGGRMLGLRRGGAGAVQQVRVATTTLAARDIAGAGARRAGLTQHSAWT